MKIQLKTDLWESKEPDKLKEYITSQAQFTLIASIAILTVRLMDFFPGIITGVSIVLIITQSIALLSKRKWEKNNANNKKP